MQQKIPPGGCAAGCGVLSVGVDRDGGGQEDGRPRAETVKVFGKALVCGVHLPHPGEDLVCAGQSQRENGMESIGSHFLFTA